ncbi:hypothetical protein GG804_02050 [Sphingomonas histidinilytica]|uniref:hypothetical protein n=1 Tax=Sphingomonadales TaxID=204457 RepID=UPI0007700871|nr:MULTISPECIES: hypothetical protein [Sphingomonadaceae]AMK23237.1 hypothetical protein K426_11505 [Sphingobium sp. TKS]MBO9375538.1 hypothetical protein [Rhizorhabdus histidinilytica]MCF8709087.1 hypothetical protein [Rhizorhapis sp. SPR117]
MQAREMEIVLDHFARSGGVAPVRPYYIWGEFRVETDGETLYSDEGHEYCRDCADRLLEKVLPHLSASERHDHRISSTELHHEDTCKHCLICGALLDYALNETGVAAELDHYVSHPPSRPLRAGDAFHIARMLEAAPADHGVLRLAREALRRIPRKHRRN